jgi:signal transduction histidine kinase
LELSREHDVLYVYYMRKSGDHPLQDIVDNDFDEETRVGLDTPPYDLQLDPWIEMALEGKANYAGLGNYTPGWDGLLSTYTPVFDRDGKVAAIAGVDILDESIVFSRQMSNILVAFQIIVVITVCASGFMTLRHYRIEAKKAREAGAAKSVFLSNMSHEFRTPLNAVIGMGELIRRTDDSGLMRNYAKDIIVAGNSLLGMVNELIENSDGGKKSS